MVSRQVAEKGIVEFLQAAISLYPHPNLSIVLVGERLPSDHSSDVDKYIDRHVISLVIILYHWDLETIYHKSCTQLMFLSSFLAWYADQSLKHDVAKPVVATNTRLARGC